MSKNTTRHSDGSKTVRYSDGSMRGINNKGRVTSSTSIEPRLGRRSDLVTRDGKGHKVSSRPRS
jgi:hypothetical protein